MARLPFNPDRLGVPEVGGPARRERARPADAEDGEPLSVSAACDLIKRALTDRFPAPIRIVGEVSNFSDRKHWYLSLKDERNVLACVMWASAAGRCAFAPERGQQVVATGRLDFYGPQGRLQLYIDRLAPVGQGALELRYRRLCEELRGLGYFEEDRKRPLPPFPRHIAVITSAGGAAVQDVVRTARNRWPGIRISIVDVRVQGAEAAGEIAAAIAAVDRHHERLGVEALILTRGGGSLEDLWAFNERAVADAVYRCGLVTVAAIGHETDLTIAELVADLRCSTPTQAAARLVPDGAAERQRLDQLTSRLTGGLRRLSEAARARLEGLAMHPLFRRPLEPILRHRNELIHLERRLQAAMQRSTAARRERLGGLRHDLGRIEPIGRLRLARHELASGARRLTDALTRRNERRRERIEALARELSAIGPQNVLRRGYSYTTTPRGNIIQSTQQVSAGDPLVTHLLDGEVHSRATGSDAPQPKPPPRPTQRPRRPRGRPKPESTPRLFE